MHFEYGGHFEADDAYKFKVYSGGQYAYWTRLNVSSTTSSLQNGTMGGPDTTVSPSLEHVGGRQEPPAVGDNGAHGVI